MGPRIMLVALLSLPVVLVYGAYSLAAARQGTSPGVFIQYDMAYYLANARQYVDGQYAWGAYANPYDFRADSPAIYFQPLTLLFALGYGVVPSAPWIPFMVIGLACTALAFATLYWLLEAYARPRTWQQGAVLAILVAWGGGLLTIIGSLESYFVSGRVDRFHIDPARGWWFLGLGRNFLYPTEAFYHLVVLGLLLAVLRRRSGWLLLLTLLLAVSHPFTGLQYSLIVLTWIVVEKMFGREAEWNWHDVGRFAAPLAFVAGYYLVFLPRFPSHRILMEQWALDWSLRPDTTLAAHALVGLLTALRWRTEGAALFARPFERFLAVAFLVSIALAHHDLILEPHQPLHFTRGHTWLPLMLLGTPVLLHWLDTAVQKRTVRTVAPVLLFAVLMLLDDASFIASLVRNPRPIGLNSSEHAILSRADQDFPNHILVSEVETVAYLSATFSSLRPFYGHWANTPWATLRRSEVHDLIQTGRIPDDLCAVPFVMIARQSAPRFARDPRFVRMAKEDDLVLYSRIGSGGCDTGPR